MNSATQILLTWHFQTGGLDDEYIEQLLETLAEGAELKEGDSLKAIDAFVEEARGSVYEPPFDELIRLALILHDEFVQLEKDEHNIAILSELDRALGAVPNNPIGKRILASKVRTLVAGLKE